MIKNILKATVFSFILCITSSCENELERTNLYDKKSPNFGNNGLWLEELKFIKDVTPSGKIVCKTRPYAMFIFKNRGLVQSSGKINIDASGNSNFSSPYRYNVEPMNELITTSEMDPGQYAVGTVRISTTCTDEFKNVNTNEMFVEDTNILSQVLIYKTFIASASTGKYYFSPGGSYDIEPIVLNNTSSILTSLQLTSITIERGNQYINQLQLTQPYSFDYVDPYKLTSSNKRFNVSIKPDAPENAEFVLRYNFNNGSRHSVRYIITK
jgi:hypothetical protein